MRKKGHDGYWWVVLFDAEKEIERTPLVGTEAEEDITNDRVLLYADDVEFKRIGTYWRLWNKDFQFVGGEYSFNLKTEGGKQFVRFSERDGLVITIT